MNAQPPEPLGSGKDLPCGWEDGRQSGFWKEQCGRVMPGPLNTFRDESMLRSSPSNPGTPAPMAASDTCTATPARVVLKMWFLSKQLIITQFILELVSACRQGEQPSEFTSSCL